MKSEHFFLNPTQPKTHTTMKHKSHKKHGYRCPSKQKGKMVNLTTATPKRLARLVHTESLLANKSVSALLLDILSTRYAHIKE